MKTVLVTIVLLFVVVLIAAYLYNMTEPILTSIGGGMANALLLLLIALLPVGGIIWYFSGMGSKKGGF
jgi:hypothetical protein